MFYPTCSQQSKFCVFLYSATDSEHGGKYNGTNAQMQNFQSGCSCGIMNLMRAKS